MRLHKFAAALALLAATACADAPTAPDAPLSPRGATPARNSSALSVWIDGPSWVTYGTLSQPGPYYEWTAYPSGGDGSYTYQWEISDVLGRTWIVDNTTQTFGTSFDCRWVNFTLTVYVTSAGQSTSSSVWVEGLGDGQCEY